MFRTQTLLNLQKAARLSWADRDEDPEQGKRKIPSTTRKAFVEWQEDTDRSVGRT